MKEPYCTICGGKHYKTFCRVAKHQPIKQSRVIKPSKKKSKTRSQIVRELDSVFSQYIRIKESVNGVSRCVTCGDIKPWKTHQCGHFYSRGRYSTRWDEDNCHVQCVGCNLFKKGNYIVYTTWMIDTYGRDFVDELGMKSINLTKITTPELKELIELYTAKRKSLKQSA